MFRSTILALGFLCGTLGVAHAAAKYAAPALGTKKCIAEFDAGSPSAVAGKTGWTVNGKGKYNYDDAYTFSKLEVYLTYTSGTGSTTGQSWSVTNESTLAKAGEFDVTFNNVTPPGAGVTLTMSAKITVTKPGAFPEVDTAAKVVPNP